MVHWAVSRCVFVVIDAGPGSTFSIFQAIARGRLHPGSRYEQALSMTRLLWLGSGLIALGLGLIGIVVPLLPTTPFLLVAAFAFAKSSQRLHAWLISHPRLGPPIEDWREQGAIRRPAKIAGLAAIAVAFALSALVGVGAGLLAIQGLVLLAAATFVITRPTPPRP